METKHRAGLLLFTRALAVTGTLGPGCALCTVLSHPVAVLFLGTGTLLS
jgi:hypothetical protein